MRVITVTWSFPEASEPFIEEKIAGLVERGVESVVVAPQTGKARAGTEVRKTPRPRSRREMARAALAAAQRDRSATRRALALPNRGDVARLLPLIDARADIIHFEFAGIALAHLGVLPQLRAAKIMTCHGSDLRVRGRRSPEVGGAFSQLFPAMDRIHCVSAELADVCLQLGARADQLHVAPMGTDLRVFTPAPFAPRPEGLATRIVSVGRVSWSKGYEHALQAVRQLRDAGYRITYTIAGGDEDAESAVTLAIHEFGLQDVVHRVGQLSRREVRDLLARSDIFLSSALSEGSSVATMDAMAMALPVVVTDVGGQSAIVQDGVHGFVVPSRDPTALADAVIKLLHSDVRRQMGEKAAIDARSRWDSSLQLDRLVEMYRTVVSGGVSQSMDSDGDLVSVVIVAHNAASTIDAQLRALSFQEYDGSWEVVVVDNCSVDDTRARAAAWADRLPNLRVVNASTRANIAHARNIGVVEAHGSRVVMCDSDDVVTPTWLSALARDLGEHPLVVGALERAMLPLEMSYSQAKVDTELRVVESFRPRFVTANVGFRREVFDAVGGFDESLQRGEDLDFGWRAIDAGFDLHFAGDAVVHYQRRLGSSATIRRGFADGQAGPALYARHRAVGMPRVRGSYRQLVRDAPCASRSRDGRSAWLYDAAQTAGRLVGSMQNLVRFF